MMTPPESKRSVHVLVPQDWDNDRRGNFLEEVAGKLLKRQRHRVTERVRYTGMEIDLVADNIDTGQRVFVECKFLREPLSANVIDLLIGKAVRKKVKLAYIFSTSLPGKEAKGVLDELKLNPDKDIPTIAFVGPADLVDMFIDVYNAERSIPDTVASASLIITPHTAPFWVLEQQVNGIPQRAVLSPLSRTMGPSFAEMRDCLVGESLYSGLEFFAQDGQPTMGTTEVVGAKPDSEIVTRITVADALDDYRPCRPQDFIGRHGIQKQVWDFLKRVRDDTTGTRILALSGPSGYGKSSIVLKLADRFRNQKWATKFFLYPIDVRSAKGPLFVAKAVRTAFQAVFDDSFIQHDFPTSVDIDSAESILQSESIQLALQLLRDSRRVLVIFFDQFEELFTKDELLPTFEAFERLAFEANSARSNLVIGFSWRTRIALSDDNPAYHVWHALRDMRTSINVDEFTSAESSELVNQFERALHQRLLPPLRRRLLEQGQGLPWFLKKLCIHVYREINKGKGQEDLLARQLNIKALFEEDLEPPTTPQQARCLRYIAKNSPADMSDVLEKFDQETVNRLYNDRLVVRTGQKYAVYWDIFRDYLVSGVIPPIPWTYVPQTQLSMAIRALMILSKSESLSLSELSQQLAYKYKTVMNLSADLQNLLLVSKDSNGRYSIRAEFRGDNFTVAVAEFISRQMREHILIQALNARLGQGAAIVMSEVKQIATNCYAAANLRSDTVDAYLKRLLPWFAFAGLLNISGDAVSIPREIGDSFGRFHEEDSRHHYDSSERLFMCESSPKKAMDLSRSLAQAKINRDACERNQYRNTASDLVALGLASWRHNELVATDELISAVHRSELRSFLGQQAAKSRFVLELEAVLTQFQGRTSRIEIGKALGKRLMRKWSDASAIRYANAGCRWIRFVGSLETPLVSATQTD